MVTHVGALSAWSGGTLGRIRQVIPAGKAVGAVPPDQVDSAPAWVTITEDES